MQRRDERLEREGGKEDQKRSRKDDDGNNPGHVLISSFLGKIPATTCGLSGLVFKPHALDATQS